MDGCSEYLSASGIQSAIQKNIRDRVKKEAVERKRGILYLILSYFKEHNLNATAECLQSEAQLTNEIEVCDNIDLDTILQEYQSYYAAKFNKQAKITKKVKNPTVVTPVPKEPKRRLITTPVCAKALETPPLEFQFDVRKLGGSGDEVSTLSQKPLCEFEGYSNEWREVAEIILKEVVPNSLGVRWSDCVGLEKCIQLLKEAVVYPLLHPCLFTGLITPWKGVLLYGPPGTGKTLLSKAVACESKMMFFNVTSSGFVHKWRGDSEKMLKVLFDVARLHAPATIFIDELDALACANADLQHDASRRFRSELLIQLDGILRDDDNIFVLATTNRPWDLDSAVLRRFEKRILVDLPCDASRSEIFKYYFSLNASKFAVAEFKGMAGMSVDYSGSDIKNACREACMRKLRQGLQQIERKEVKAENLKVNSPSMDDVVKALDVIRPVTNSRVREKYVKWRDEFGSY